MNMRHKSSALIFTALLMCVQATSASSIASDETLESWAKQFKHSTLNHQQRVTELQWFRQAAKKFRGKKITSVAEGIKTHKWERDVLAKAFYEIAAKALS